MTRVVINEAGIRHFTRAEDGPVGRYLARKATGVTTRAVNNAAGRPGPRIRSGDLQGHLRFAGIFENDKGLYAVVGSDARHRGFPYPLALELGYDPLSGKPLPYRYPWLVPALKEEFA